MRTLSAVFGLMWLASASAGQTPLLVAPAERGVVLRWVWDEGPRPAGYFVERRQPGGAWARLNPQPIVRVRDRAAARAQLGEQFTRYEGLLFPADPRAERADPETHRGVMLLSADLEPAVARLLGLRYDDTAAAAGVAYEYRLVALTGAGERLAAVSPAVMAGGFQPGPGPEAVTAVAGGRGAALRWSAAPRFSGYHVWRGARRDGSGARRLNAAPVIVFIRDDGGAVEASNSFFTDTVPARDSVYYWIEGIDAFGRVSRRSAAAPFAWRVVTALAAPPLVQARAQGDTVLVSWLAPNDTAVSAYQVWRAERDTGPFVRLGEPVRAPGGSLRDPGRPAGTVSWYRVTALDRTGRVSEPSPVALAEVPDLTPPAAPESLAARADTGRFWLRWRSVAARDLRGYRVYRAATADGTFGLLTPQPRREPTFVDSIPRRADHPFHYRVTAVDSAFNESAPSAVLAVRPPDVTAPSAPRIATVRALDAALAVTWLPNPEPDVVAYRVRYRGRDDAGWLEVPVATPAAILADTIPGLAPGRPYDVSLVAVDDAGNRSAPAPLVPGTPVRRRAPDRPDLRRAAYDGKSGGAVLEWARPATEAAVVLVMRRQGDQAWRPIAELPGTATRFVDRLARHGQRYEYQVRVRDAFGNVAESRARRVVVPEGAR